jgi:hypothetical protein
MGGFSESDIAVLTSALNKDFSDYDGPDDEQLLVSPVDNAAASATRSTCLQIPSPDALTRTGDLGGHIQLAPNGG